MKFLILTKGCKTNHLEEQIMQELLINEGHILASNPKEADVFILNSCSVTAHSDSETLYNIKKIKKENPDIKIVLTGCMAQTKEAKELDFADLILGNSEKLSIEKKINSLFQDKKYEVKNIFDIKEFENRFLYNTTSTRPSIKIQDGCNNRCSYCTIPFARGNSRSNSIQNIIEQINIHTKNNKKEIVLVGIHIGQWGYDFNKKLVDLLSEIEKTDILRYRLGSLYVNEIDDELLNFLINSKKFCPHFHLSLQSLSDKILKLMNRNYTKKEVYELVSKIKQNFDNVYIGCDIITGFPNETREDFLETKNSLIGLNVSYIHSFPYSKRKNTKAALMENQVLEHEKKERTKELIEVSNSLHKKFLDENRNKTKTIIYEKKSKDGFYTGVSENYIKVLKKSDSILTGTIENCNLNEFEFIY